MGRETARQTHEITNVHNIINEMIGLIGDFVAAAATGQEINTERIQDILQRMQVQIQRGNFIVRGLNRFAHSVDVPFGMFELKDLAERVEFSAERPVRLAKATLLNEAPASNATLEGFLLGHQQAIIAALEWVLEAGGKTREISIQYQTNESEVTVTVGCETRPVAGDSAKEIEQELIDLVSDLGGRVEIASQEDENLSVTLVFPVFQA